MEQTKKVLTICGGGSLGHVIAAWVSAHNYAFVNILTARPAQWQHEIHVDTPDGKLLKGVLNLVTDDPAQVIPQSDVVLLCLPGFLISNELKKIRPHLLPYTYVGSVFSSTGFFFEALALLSPLQPLWGFQRVPFIARVDQYGRSAHLLGYKASHQIAVEHTGIQEKECFRAMIQTWFERPVNMLSNYYEASLTNSNPLLHTSRLYSMFAGKNEGRVFPRMIMFYEEWTGEAAELLIKMDEEFFSLLRELPVSPTYLPTILDYYESTDATSLARKLSSIAGFKGITSPMKQVGQGWVPDFESRYFTEDFPYGLRLVWQLAHEKGVPCPTIDKVYEWGMSKVAMKAVCC